MIWHLRRVGSEGCLEGDWKDGPCPPVIRLLRGTPEGTFEGRGAPKVLLKGTSTKEFGDQKRAKTWG